MNQDANQNSTSSSQQEKKTAAHVLGEIVWILSRTETYKHLTLRDIEKYIMPAILLGQIRIDRVNSIPQSVEVYAMVDELTRSKICATHDIPDIHPIEWRCGNIKLIIIEARLQ